MYSEQFNALMNDQDFVVKMLSQESAEDVQKLYAENGVELTMDEVKALGEALDKVDQPEGELDEDALENVSGGVLTALAVAKCIIGVGGAALAIYKWYKSR